LERRYRVRIEVDEAGFYIATVPSVPGVVEQGDSEEEAIERLKASLDTFLTDALESGDPVPSSDPVDRVVDVNVTA
jgi:predicted RNase H-like HicB family nuclease